MALIVETGSGLSNSDSYATIAEADTYQASHGAPSAWADTKATGSLIISAQPSNGDTFTIDSNVYTFQTVLTDVDGNILIGTDVSATKINIVDSINGNTSNAGIAPSTTAHPDVESTGFSDTVIAIQALVGGTDGNAIATTSTFTDSSNAFSDITLSGGVNDKELALRLGTQYLDAKYNLRWVGRTHSRDQSLDWPRDNASKRDGWDILPLTIPQELKDGLFEASLISISGTDLFDETQTTTGNVQSFTNKVASLSQSKTFVGGGQTPNKKFPIVDQLLRPILLMKGQVTRA